MGEQYLGNSADTAALLERIQAGDNEALNELFSRHRDRLRRMVDIRIDRRVQGRVDASDVVQEAYLEVSQRLGEYLNDPKMPLFLWLRLVVGERLMKLHRHHLGTQMRDAGREISLFRGPMPMASSAALAAKLLGRLTSPTQAVVRAERLLRMQEAINSLDPLDREILSLRHFEELTRSEAAQALEITDFAMKTNSMRKPRPICSDTSSFIQRLQKGLSSFTRPSCCREDEGSREVPGTCKKKNGDHRNIPEQPGLVAPHRSRAACLERTGRPRTGAESRKARCLPGLHLEHAWRGPLSIWSVRGSHPGTGKIDVASQRRRSHGLVIPGHGASSTENPRRSPEILPTIRRVDGSGAPRQSRVSSYPRRDGRFIWDQKIKVSTLRLATENDV